jgi:hypothetical protein
MGFCAFSEDTDGILCIFGRSSWDFVHFWKFFVGFCAFLEVPHVILCSFGSSYSKNAQNPMRNFQKCTKLYEELPKMHKMP